MTMQQQSLNSVQNMKRVLEAFIPQNWILTALVNASLIQWTMEIRHVFVCVPWVYVFICMHVYFMYAFVCIRVRVCMRVCMHLCMKYVCNYLFVCVCMNICVNSLHRNIIKLETRMTSLWASQTSGCCIKIRQVQAWHSPFPCTIFQV